MPVRAGQWLAHLAKFSREVAGRAPLRSCHLVEIGRQLSSRLDAFRWAGQGPWRIPVSGRM